MKNKLSDLNNHLFAQIERLGGERLKGEKLEEEIKRSKAVTQVAGKILSVAEISLRARVAVGESIPGTVKIPKMLEE